jgi:hypothetical protein
MSISLLDLSAITLLCVETRDPVLAHFAIQKCTQQARFGKAVLITDLRKLSKHAGDAVDQKADQKAIASHDSPISDSMHYWSSCLCSRKATTF